MNTHGVLYLQKHTKILTSCMKTQDFSVQLDNEIITVIFKLYFKYILYYRLYLMSNRPRV